MLATMAAEKDKQEENTGIVCPHCGCADLRVVYTRRYGTRKIRRRECRHCGRRMFTFEEKVT